MVKDEEYNHLGYSSFFDGFPIAPFIDDTVQARHEKRSVDIVTLDELDISIIKEKIEQALVQSLKSLNIIPFEAIDLNRIDPECWDIGSRLVPMVTVISWEKEKFNEIIKDVANDNSRVFFFSPAKNRIVAPYDGGIDIILEDEKTKNFYRSKYHRWTPKNEAGL